ncbi:GNAT family N-acetyltransferase [Providencia vermicola]|uniref:GNAT family N-acetyltransferase n=1 Tax=Providencia vermicola TaxID=333965 RepID=UPI0034D4F583
MEVILRKATEQDATLLYNIGMESYLYHFAKLWLHADELASYLYHEYSPHKIIDDISRPDTDWFIIENTQPIGIVKLTYHAAITNESIIGTQLNKLYFLPTATGKGNGKSIFNQIESLAKQHGDRLLWLDVLAENHSAANFYQANGMSKFKETTFTHHSQQSIAFIMSKTL